MASRYARFAELHQQGKHAFIPFTLLGWPSPDLCLQTLQCMVDAGAAALELGLAFSDPVADGPVIQAAVHQTLASGFDVEQAFALISCLRKKNAEIPIGLLVYFNMVLARGIDKFYADAAHAGVDSILIADLPADCAEEVAPAASKHGIDQIFIISPLTTADRLEKILLHASGYLYIVSRLGITGTEVRYDEQLKNILQATRAKSSLPLCVGFGVSTPEQARHMIQLGADGAITGSRIIELLQSRGDASVDSVLSPYLQRMVTSLNNVPLQIF